MKELIKTTAKALLTAIVTVTVLAFIFAFFAYKSSDPAALTGGLAMAAFIVSCMVGGWVSRGKGNILSCILFACVYSIVYLAAALISGGKANIGVIMLSYLLSGFAAAILVGILSGNSRKKRKKPKLNRPVNKKTHRPLKNRAA